MVLRRKLKEIHEEFKLTLIYVTHDQVEALTFADQVVVMHEGHVVQVGSPADLFERPTHTFVGHFIGSPGMNIIPCGIDGGRPCRRPPDRPRPRSCEAGVARERETCSWAYGRSLFASGKRRRRLPAGRDHAGRGSGRLHDTTARLGEHLVKAKASEDMPCPRRARLARFSARMDAPLRRRRLLCNRSAHEAKNLDNRAWFLVLPVVCLSPSTPSSR